MVPASDNIKTGKVSIVIPCYNHGKTLPETLASIESARNDNLLEVIIVNDGSTDPQTCRLFDELAGSSYVIVNQPNCGLGAARNAGIRLARGEFILPLDSDNLVRKVYLTDGVEALLAMPDVGVVYGDAEYFGETTGRWRIPEFNVVQLAGGNYIDACALYRRSIWESVMGYDEKMPQMGYEDWDFWLRVAARGWQFLHLDQIAFDYRVSSHSMLRTVTSQHEEMLRAYVSSKREIRNLRLLLEQDREIRRFQSIEQSKEYRLGRVLLKPLRKLKGIFDGTSANGR